MPRQALNREIHSTETKIEQKRDTVLSPAEEREIGDIVVADASLIDKEYQAELAFMEEPVTIRIDPGAEEHAPQHVKLTVNGKGCEVLINDKWREFFQGWIPVNQILTIKRKYLEVLARSKIDRIETVMPEMGAPESQMAVNSERRFTRQSHSFSVIRDENPRGAAWLSEVIRRNM